jgi:hypothetical protein
MIGSSRMGRKRLVPRTDAQNAYDLAPGCARCATTNCLPACLVFHISCPTRMPASAIPLKEFDAEMASTPRLLERVPTDKGTWEPHEKSFPLDKVFMSSPRGETVRQHLSHLVHHRGQLTVYLRLVDVPLPSIYGPTADETWSM